LKWQIDELRERHREDKIRIENEFYVARSSLEQQKEELEKRLQEELDAREEDQERLRYLNGNI